MPPLLTFQNEVVISTRGSSEHHCSLSYHCYKLADYWMKIKTFPPKIMHLIISIGVLEQITR
jgi:hypothetical protein